MQLKELKVGDWFYPKSKEFKATPVFEVVNKHTGMSGKIQCKNLVTGRLVNKIAKQEVVKQSNPLITRNAKEVAEHLIKQNFPIERYKMIQTKRKERLARWEENEFKELANKEKELITLGEEVLLIMKKTYKQDGL